MLPGRQGSVLAELARRSGSVASTGKVRARTLQGSVHNRQNQPRPFSRWGSNGTNRVCVNQTVNRGMLVANQVLLQVHPEGAWQGSNLGNAQPRKAMRVVRRIIHRVRSVPAGTYADKSKSSSKPTAYLLQGSQSVTVVLYGVLTICTPGTGAGNGAC